MRVLYSILIYATMTLAIATVWAVGRDHQAQSDLARAQKIAAVPQFNEELERAAAARAADHDATTPTPATRPVLAPPSKIDPARRPVPADACGFAP